jgi:hypothetical protein
MRDNIWLKEIAQNIWHRYFSDVSPTNDLRVKFGKHAKWQLGCIRQVRKSASPSIVVINGYFRNPVVPQYVIESVLAHEFIHYISGFSSSKPRLYRYPHRGGIMEYEMRRRGLSALERKQKKWIEKHWKKTILI